jgi:hypothetical protein
MEDNTELDYVEAYFDHTSEISFAADFDFNGIHFKVEAADEEATVPKVTMTIIPSDDTNVDFFRCLAFNFTESIFSEATNNDACELLVRERYQIPESVLTYVVTIEDYLS